MPKSKFKDNTAFVLRVTAYHVLTYIICGLIFSLLFDYKTLYTIGNASYFMRELSSLSTVIGPAVQIIRGILFGLVFLIFRDSVFSKPFSWLRLWAIIAILGIINTPGPSPASIEGIIYTSLPLEFHLKGMPEILIQTLLLSILVTRSKRESRINVSEKTKTALFATIIAGVGFSVSGVILAIVIGVDFMAGASDMFAFAVMFAALLVVFLATKFFKYNTFVNKLCYYLVCYIALAAFPTIYNFVTNSVMKSWLSLLISALPVVMIWIYRLQRGEKDV